MVGIANTPLSTPSTDIRFHTSAAGSRIDGNAWLGGGTCPYRQRVLVTGHTGQLIQSIFATETDIYSTRCHKDSIQ